MRSKSNVWEEPETLRLLGLDERREGREKRDLRLARMNDEEFLRHLDNEAMERAADRIDEISAGWADPRGFPLPGFESVRFMTEREREYKRWYRGSSSEAVRTRRVQGR